MEWNLSHSEGNWLCDYTFQPKIYPILRELDYMIITSSQKSVPFGEELTLWWYCKPKIHPILRRPDYMIMFPAKNLYHSEGTWLCHYKFQLKTYPILSRTDYLIIFFSRKSIPFWGDLSMWLYFSAKNLSHSEGTWLYDCILRNEIHPTLMGPDYVIVP